MDDGQRKKKQRILVFKFVCAAVMLIMVILVISFGWFADSTQATNDGTDGKSASGDYKIVTVGTDGRYDSRYVSDTQTAENGDDETVREQVLQKGTETKFYLYEPQSENSEALTGYVSKGNDIIWEMTSAASYNNYNGKSGEEASAREIAPGTWGYVDFYIVPVRTGEISISCELDLTAYCSLMGDELAADEQKNGDKIVYGGTEYYPYSSEENADNLNSLLKGHLMFFSVEAADQADGEDQLKWISPDGNGKLSFDVNLNITKDYEVSSAADGIEKYRAVKQRIYWVWPNIFGQAVLSGEKISALDGNYKTVPQILNDMSDADNTGVSVSDDIVSAGFKNLLTNESNYGYFFLNSDKELVTGSKNGALEINGTVFSTDDYENLKQAWNNADQEIGNKVGYITAELVTYNSTSK